MELFAFFESNQYEYINETGKEAPGFLLRNGRVLHVIDEVDTRLEVDATNSENHTSNVKLPSFRLLITASVEIIQNKDAKREETFIVWVGVFLL